MDIFSFLGKDRVVFLTKDDLNKPSSVVLPASTGEEIEGQLSKFCLYL